MILTGKRRNRTSVEDQIKRDQREQNTHRSEETIEHWVRVRVTELERTLD